MIADYVVKGKILVLVKTGAFKSEILGFDKDRSALKIALKAQPIDGKANTELLRLFKKETGKVWEIISGKTSKLKLLRETT